MADPALRAGEPILYDPDCGFCLWTLGVVLRWDRRHRLRPVALGSEEAGRLLADMDPADRMRSAHLVGADGRVYSGGAALEPLARRLPGGGPLARLAAAAPGLMERGYRLVADHRSWWGRVTPARGVARARALIEQRS